MLNSQSEFSPAPNVLLGLPFPARYEIRGALCQTENSVRFRLVPSSPLDGLCDDALCPMPHPNAIGRLCKPRSAMRHVLRCSPPSTCVGRVSLARLCVQLAVPMRRNKYSTAQPTSHQAPPGGLVYTTVQHGGDATDDRSRVESCVRITSALYPARPNSPDTSDVNSTL